MFYKDKNVFDEALDRIRFVYDNCDDVIVSMSGGKDSAVLFNLAMTVAKERNRLPLKVFWLDQEAEWKHTYLYMKDIMYREDVKPYWFQVEFDFTNSLSAQNNFLRVWDKNCPEKWIRQKDEISIKENPSSFNRFHDLVENLPAYCTDKQTKHCAVLVGMRITESLNRKMTIAHSKSQFAGITWCRSMIKNTRVFYPIYDFKNEDIWTALGKNHWSYNKIYDFMYQYGVPLQNMRVSALIHETSWHAIEMLQEFERDTYNKFVARINGVSTFNHAFDECGIIPKELPFAFKDWKEYRDYLLFHITKPEYWELFRNRWKKQDGDDWYKVHIREIIINDIDGTINANARTRMRMRKNAKKGQYYARDKAKFDKYMEDKNK